MSYGYCYFIIIAARVSRKQILIIVVDWNIVDDFIIVIETAVS